jgi:hypothetical protein
MKAEEFLKKETLDGFGQLNASEQKKVIKALKEQSKKEAARPAGHTRQKSLARLG